MPSALPSAPHRRRGAGSLLGLLLAGSASAAYAAPAVAPVPGPASGIFHVLLGLAVVLLVMWACAWALKRYTGTRRAPAGALRVVGAVAVGQRERVVMVEVGETWLIVGVGPGQVNALHTMPRLAAPAPSPGAPPAGGFAARFTQMLERRNRDR